MELREVLAKRRMVRNYSDEPVPSDVLERIVDAGLRAPSAGFSQGQRFVVVTGTAQRNAVAESCREHEYVQRGFDPWISRAPAHIVLCVDRDAYLKRYSEPDKAAVRGRTSREGDWTVPYWWVDAGATLMAVLLAAVDEGLGAGFLGAHVVDDLHTTLDIPPEILIVGIVTVGYPLPDRRSSSLGRGWLDRDTVVSYESWGRPRA